MAKTPQRLRVLDYIKRNGSITAMDAVNDLGIIDLAARIRDLRREGVPIVSTPERGINRFGERCDYVRYSL